MKNVMESAYFLHCVGVVAESVQRDDAPLQLGFFTYKRSVGSSSVSAIERGPLHLSERDPISPRVTRGN